HLAAERFGRACHGLSAQRAIELDGWLVVGQRPDHQALDAALGEVTPRRAEQAAAETKALVLWAQIELVDLALVGEAAGAVAAVVGVARNSVAEHEQRDAAALADRAIPPRCTAPIDQAVQLKSGDDPLISGAPSLVMRSRKGCCIRWLRSPDLYELRA